MAGLQVTRAAGGVTQATLDAHTTAASAHGVTVVRKTADETVTNSTTLQDDNHIVLPVLANETWHFRLVLFLTAPDTDPDWKFGWTVPASATMLWSFTSGVATIASFSAQATTGTPAAMLTEGGTATMGSQNVNHGAVVEGVIRVAGTAGNVQFQWAQNTADLVGSTILEDSHIIARRIATS